MLPLNLIFFFFFFLSCSSPANYYSFSLRHKTIDLCLSEFPQWLGGNSSSACEGENKESASAKEKENNTVAKAERTRGSRCQRKHISSLI